MKIDKAIRTAPWPEPFVGNQKQHFRMTLTWPVVNHEKLLVATFVWNASRNPNPNTRDFRLICSKKLPAAAILYKGGSRGSRKELSAAMGIHTGWCYPEISEKDEKALAKWLGKKPGDTKNHFMPELDAWNLTGFSIVCPRKYGCNSMWRNRNGFTKDCFDAPPFRCFGGTYMPGVQ